jgi:hypothetical protein
MPPRIRLTKTLLDSWLWVFQKDDGREDFLRTLNREKTPPTEAMLNGTQFENCVNSVLDGSEIDPAHKWYKGITDTARYLTGAQKQVVLFREIEVDGEPFLMHGVLDFLRAGVIYDTKFTKNYHLNKYLDTAQTPVYLYLVPEARRMEYVVCDGTWVYREVYPREIVQPLEPLIKQFMAFVRKHELYGTLAEKWKVQN